MNISNWFQGLKSKIHTSFREKLYLKFQKETVVYDCEIVRSIPNGEHSPELEYCQGWEDYKGMGISVICAYTSWYDRYWVFLEDNFADFQQLINQAEEIVGFNSLEFDDKLCAAHGLQIKTTYDLLSHVRVAAGMPPHYVKGKTRAGYSLEQLARANLGYGKLGKGDLAAELWQRGKRGTVISYCLGDVSILKKLYEKRAKLIDPTNGNILTLG